MTSASSPNLQGITPSGQSESLAPSPLVGSDRIESDPAQGHFTGALDALSVADVIQMLQLSGKSGVVTVSREGLDSWIWCNSGAIVDAESGRLRGEPALYRILSMQEGWLIADLRPVERKPRIDLPVQYLLLEGARQKDEVAQVLSRIGGPHQGYQLAETSLLAVDGSAHDREDESLSSVADRALQRSFSRGKTVEQAMQSSGRSDLDTVKAIERWVEAGQLIEGERSVRPLEQMTPVFPLNQRDRRLTESLAPLVSESARPKTARARPPVSTWLLGLSLLLAFASLVSLWMHKGDFANAAVNHYSVRVQAIPAWATMRLDGQSQGPGPWQLRLPSDGTTHQLTVQAEDYVPARIVFRDAPPPATIVLDPLRPTEPAPTVALAAVSQQAPSPAAVTQAPGSLEHEQYPPEDGSAKVELSLPSSPPKSPPGRTTRPRPKVRQKTHRTKPNPPVPPRQQPRVELIGGNEPQVDVLY